MKIAERFWNKQRKGFTIVELVIVIAVIAILAAVLIPTFSSLIKKANLSADKQAVREMNIALAADEELHGKADTVEKAMRILANAGYNSDNWVCLTKGYEVYWYSKENRLVLYNSTTAQVEYPTDFNITKLVTADNGGQFYIYNNNQVKAINTNVSIGSSTATTSMSGLSSNDSVAASTTATSAVGALSTALSSNSAIKDALNLNLSSTDEVKVYGTKEVVSQVFGSGSNTAQAAMQVVAVGDTDTPVLKNNGEVQENVFYIQVATSGNPTATELAAASKAAGDMVYTLFTQINTSQITDNAAIILAPGTTIDVSGKEWAAVKEFEGYFGTTDASNPIVIDGAEMTSATGYSQTVSFTGSQSRYFVTGFFGTVYGDTTIENVKFTNIKLNQPAMDYSLVNFKINGKAVDSRNTIGIIGGITENTNHTRTNVVLRNIEVDNTCEVICGADGGGLVGYIGSADPLWEMDGTVLIEGCKVSARVSNNYKYVSSAYGPVGGIVGFLCRVASDSAKYNKKDFTLTIKDCTFNGSVDGTTMIGAAIGDLTNNCNVKFEGTNDFEHASINSKGLAQVAAGAVIGTVTSTATANLTFGGTIKVVESLPAYYVGAVKYDLNKAKIQ